ncbi:MAG: hypothetical protein U0X91_03105 [Spirosomataceae bacterium]
MRGQMPLLFLLGIFLTRNIPLTELRFKGKKAIIRSVVTVYLLLSPLLLLSGKLIKSIQYNQLTQVLWPGSYSYTALPFDKFTNTYQMLYEKYSPAEAQQYLGKKNSMYERYFARKTKEPFH